MTTLKTQPIIDKKLEKMILDNIFRTLINDGSLSIDDFKDKNLLKGKLTTIIKNTEFVRIIDYKDSLLNTAKMFSDKKEYLNAKMFYATYIEHELNHIVVELCRRKKIDKKFTNEIIKCTTMISKLTWLPLLLGIPQVNDKHKKVLVKLIEERNGYVHYKYSELKEGIEGEDEQEYLNEMKKILQSISYLKKYSSRILFNNKKTHIEKHLKKQL